MSLQDNLPVGSIVLPAYLTAPANDAWARHDLSAAMRGLGEHRRTRQQPAVDTIVAIAKRLVDTATFILSAEDFAILEAALNDYDNQ